MKAIFPTLVLACVSTLAASAQTTPAASPVAAIAVPGTSASHPFKSWDGIYVEPFFQIGVLGSRSSKAITLFDAANDQMIGETAPVFTGVGPDVENSGPNGVLVAGFKIWGGDYPSTVRVFDPLQGITQPPQVAVIDTGGVSRVDSLDYDPFRDIVMASNSDTSPNPAFVSIISNSSYKILHKIVFDGTNGTPDASVGGIGGVLFDYFQNRFLVAITQVGNDSTKGAITAVDPASGKVTEVISGIDNCQPSTLVEGPYDNVLVTCDPGFPAPDPVVFAPRTYVVNARSGQIVANITQTGGADLAAYNIRDNRYYLASRDYFTSPSAAKATPVLGIIDAGTNQFIANIPTAPNTHSVAVNPFNNQIFLPIATGNALCKGLPGCVAVFQSNAGR